jgi:hypothetical protein
MTMRAMVDAETKLSDRIFMILAGEYYADGVLSTFMIVMHGNVMFVRRTGGGRAAARFGHKEGARLLTSGLRRTSCYVDVLAKDPNSAKLHVNRREKDPMRIFRSHWTSLLPHARKKIGWDDG